MATLLRADWDIGQTLSRYFRDHEGSDAVVGRMVAGLDPRQVTFALLPPHFVKWNHELQDIMELQFPRETNPVFHQKTLNKMLMASLIFHREEIKKELGESNPGHPLFQTEVFKLSDEVYQRARSCLYESPDGDTMPTLVGDRPEGEMRPCGLPAHTTMMALQLEERAVRQHNTEK